MSTNILPDFIEFGDTDEFYPDLESIESLDLENSPSAIEEVEPYGYDLLFDFSILQSSVTPSGDLKITPTEKLALTQWISVALASPRGQDLLYSERFGSNLEALINQGVNEFGIESNITNSIKDTLTQHDRITEIRDFSYIYNSDNTTLTIGFVVVTDDSDELVFEGLQLGR